MTQGESATKHHKKLVHSELSPGKDTSLIHSGIVFETLGDVSLMESTTCEIVQ